VYAATLSTPIGPFTVVADDAAVLASGWTTDVDELLRLVHPRLRPAAVTVRRDFGDVTRALTAYLSGDVHAIDPVPVQQVNAEFRMHAWDVLRKVPAGAPVTYAEFAAMAGRPAAVRAAASACAVNSAALFVPCHRVLRSGGGLGGYRWGVDVKQWLLDHEAAAA